MRIDSEIRIRRFLLWGRAESREKSKTTDRNGHRAMMVATFLEIGNWDDIGFKTLTIYKSVFCEALQFVHNVEASESVQPDLYTRAYIWGDLETQQGPSTEGQNACRLVKGKSLIRFLRTISVGSMNFNHYP
jgi:hypothetical protein